MDAFGKEREPTPSTGSPKLRALGAISVHTSIGVLTREPTACISRGLAPQARGSSKLLRRGWQREDQARIGGSRGVWHAPRHANTAHLANTRFAVENDAPRCRDLGRHPN